MTSSSTALSKEMSFVPQLGDTGTISSLQFGVMGNDLLLAASCFNTGVDLIKVVPNGQSMFFCGYIIVILCAL